MYSIGKKNHVPNVGKHKSTRGAAKHKGCCKAQGVLQSTRGAAKHNRCGKDRDKKNTCVVFLFFLYNEKTNHMSHKSLIFFWKHVNGLWSSVMIGTAPQQSLIRIRSSEE